MSVNGANSANQNQLNLNQQQRDFLNRAQEAFNSNTMTFGQFNQLSQEVFTAEWSNQGLVNMFNMMSQQWSNKNEAMSKTIQSWFRHIEKQIEKLDVR